MGIQRKAAAGKFNHTTVSFNLTYRCNLRCPGCAAAIWQAPEKKDLDEETLDKFIDGSLAANWKWKIIKITGGEPTLHPRLIEFAKKIRAAFGEKVTYRLLTNRRSEVKTRLKKLVPWLRCTGPDKKGRPTKHLPVFLAPCDDHRRTMDFTKGCCRLKRCGVAYGLDGKYYPCNVCLHIDRVFDRGLGCNSLAELAEVDEGMMLRKYCSRCGLITFPRFVQKNRLQNKPVLEAIERIANTVSPTWARAFQDYARRKGQPCGIMLPVQSDQ